MAQLQVEDLSPILIQQLETLAKLHGRSLQEEVKHILQQAAQSQLRFYRTGGDMAKAREAVTRSQVRYTGRTFSDSAELIREDRDR
jgi:plasmid stability protein